MTQAGSSNVPPRALVPPARSHQQFGVAARLQLRASGPLRLRLRARTHTTPAQPANGNQTVTSATIPRPPVWLDRLSISASTWVVTAEEATSEKVSQSLAGDLQPDPGVDEVGAGGRPIDSYALAFLRRSQMLHPARAAPQMSKPAATAQALPMMSGSTFVIGPLVARVIGLLTPPVPPSTAM